MNALRLTKPHPPDQGPPAPRTDQVAAWLDLLASLLRIPPAERRSVRDELEDHLRQRVRDLILAGEEEPAAVRTAISELGDAAALAQSLSHARNAPKRRKLMALAATGLAAIAAVTGIALYSHNPAPIQAQPGGVPVSVFQPIPAADATKLASVRITTKEGASLGDIMEFAGKALGMPVTVRWTAIQQASSRMSPDSRFSEPISGLSLPEFVVYANEQFGAPTALDFRVTDGRLVFSSTDNFDRADTALVTYDLHQIIESMGGDTDAVTCEAIKVMTSVVYPDLWRENGGDAASTARFGTKLFITAPKRVHEKVRWVLSEMTPPQPPAGAGAGNPAEPPQAPLALMMARAQQDVAAERARADQAAAVARDMLLRTEAERAKSNAALAELTAASAKAIPLSNASADAVADIARQILGSDPTDKEGGVSFAMDARTNSIIVKASKEKLALIERVISFLDNKDTADRLKPAEPRGK